MKTYTIKTPTAELLVAELPEDSTLKEIIGLIGAVENNSPNYHLTVYSFSDYTILGKPDEVKEEDAMELVESDEISDVEDYRYQITFIDYKDEENAFPTAKESLLSLLESEIHWNVNPLGKEPKINGYLSDSVMSGKFDEDYEQWYEAEQKTFSRNRTLIFKKNK